ncbi:MAG: bifunctional homocysteine S-methyltransferase/methylenetetrahydrofolate reductase [Terrimicrobiaceae bacterium]|nr:bifunctional homocysteine S-methyltransferase/methylenetetrahydrofolate reductase [Terrimicrobiaceae bacterium]
MDLLALIETRVLCADGAMGTLLMDRGVAADRCFEEVCLRDADLVRGIHEEYLEAGARLIGTNSFGANAHKLARHGLEHHVNEINWQAAQLAKHAARGRDAFVLGCVGPLGLSGREADALGVDRRGLFREQIGALLDGGVNGILLETFQDLDELELAILIKQELHHCPVIASLAAHPTGALADGTPFANAVERLAEAGADVVGLNCVSGPRDMLRLLERLPADIPLAVFPNAGRPHYYEGRYVYETPPEYFAELAAGMAAEGARIVGGCCGTTPAHIAAIARALQNVTPVRAKTISVSSPAPIAPASAAEPSILDLIDSGRTVIITELDPPKHLSLDRYYAAAAALTAAGSDAITLADNSLAILRVSNLAVGAELKRRGITPLLHMSCRDRNTLGLQSDLLGMAALGIRHVLPLTGDPAKVGDHPGAKSVYDVTSIQLIEMIARLNEGFTQAGTDLRGRPGFVAGCTFNPNARSLDAQSARLERKLAAGARYVMTQPVFDSALVASTAKRLAPLGVPVFIGVWPLLSGRQASFLHNEVPGISIPGAALDRMNGREGVDGRAVGVAIAKEVATAVLDHFPGVYLITPGQAFETTAELAAFVRGIAR